MVAGRHYYDPFSLWNSLDRSVGGSFDQASVEQQSEEARSWMPGVDIYEETDGYVLLVDVPGVAPDEIDITLNNGVLTVQGERRLNQLPDTAKYQYRERGFGKFERHFRLPEKADSQQVSASSEHGVLKVRIGKSAKAQPRRINVSH